MKLRSDCTSHKRTTRRALRLALAMALVGGSSPAHAVEMPPHACTAPLNHPQHAEAGLLPYPFEQSPAASRVNQSEKAQRLVRLVGLQHEPSTAGRCANVSQHPQPMTPSVVAASATAAEEAQPLPTSSTSQTAVCEAGSLGDSLSESLIDIKIPLAGVQVDTAPESTGTTQVSRQGLPSTAPQTATRGSNAGLVQVIQPPQLLSSAAETVSPPHDTQPGASHSENLAHSDRKPELVQASRPMSIAKPGTPTPSVSLSFSDLSSDVSTSSHSAASSKPPTLATSAGDSSVSLHLSSASQVPLTTPSTIQLPQHAPGMQVRVEGEPELGKRIKASFASRTIQIPDREPMPLAEPPGQKTSQRGEVLSVGLQESQALSAEFPITQLSVEHPTICQLMQTGENSVSLIGMRPGSTRIALITVDDDGERQVEIHEVSVGTSAPSEQRLSDLAKEISRTVGKLVPHSDVEIVAYTDYLLVHGFTPYESDAKKILTVVRKTALVPVVDQLRTNER